MSLNGKTRIIIMELVKAAKVIEKSVTEMTEAEAWAAFFEYLTDRGKSEKITEIVNREGGIAMAANALFNITDDEREYARLTSELKYDLDLQSGMVNAKREGIQQGLQQGIQRGLQQGMQQGRLETSLEYIQKMKALGLSSEQIQAVTGLSEQQIKDI
jgi:predicted transposase/invertase (TIGR01784 family)